MSEPTRGTEIYVSWPTRKALSLIVLKHGQELGTNADAIAEHVLSDWIKAKHGDVAEFIAQEHLRAKEFKERLIKP
jgi:mannose/cellobiose epimerase-like protein (N-acyl-D-glucosamine 2-epimerase family)